jgi:hypothetical protein
LTATLFYVTTCGGAGTCGAADAASQPFVAGLLAWLGEY